ncbi:MAG: SUF system Fe-S cluster assembly regulator [Alphaproteobacteria bacterium]|nr:MAG: SUF system Fe-S cluster assembly regulator [Alphaproteobacteria bacterium]
MLKLSRLTDYAVVALFRLWQDAPEQKTATQLAMETGLPEPTLVKILKTLARAGLVSSRRGSGGGYYLGKEKGRVISVKQIIEAMEGPIALTTCIETPVKNACAISAACPVQTRWTVVNSAICDVLDQVMLADMHPVQAVPAAEAEKAVAHG